MRKTTVKAKKRRVRIGTERRGPIVGNDTLIQPWFLNVSISRAIRRLIPREYHLKMYWFFEEFGCIHCERKDVLYGSNGFCVQCQGSIRRRLGQVVKQRAKSFPLPSSPPPNQRYIDRVAHAEKLLRGIIKRKRTKRTEAPPNTLPKLRYRQNVGVSSLVRSF